MPDVLNYVKEPSKYTRKYYRKDDVETLPNPTNSISNEFLILNNLIERGDLNMENIISQCFSREPLFGVME